MGKMRGAKIKTMKISSSSSEDVKDLQKMFSQITGTSDADRNVLIPKINAIFKNVVEYKKLYSILLNFTAFTTQFEEYKIWFEEIDLFMKTLVESTNVDITKKYNETTIGPYSDLDDVKLNAFYKDLKSNEFVKKIVITGSNLSAYKKHLTDELDDIFIKREPGIVLQPLAFSSLDLKIIWNTENFTDKGKTFILSILKRTYAIGIELYDIITSPDVDIKKFSKVLVDSIAKMKKQIPRCDKAFGIIENSVKMLEDNFKSYFRGSVEAGNPNIIIESFIVDISTTQKASPSVTNEFRKIVMFLKERSSQAADPKIQKLFGMLNSQFSAIDSELGIKKTPEDIPDSATAL